MTCNIGGKSKVQNSVYFNNECFGENIHVIHLLREVHL